MTNDAAFYSSLGPRLQQAREREYLPVRQLAARAGIPPKTLRRWELGQVIPETPGLIALCRALHIDLDTLFPPTSCWHRASQSPLPVVIQTTVPAGRGG